MLCFMQGFDSSKNGIQSNKFQSVKSKLLKKSRSSNSFGLGSESGPARSAPSTPQTGLSPSEQARSQPNTPTYNHILPKSPSHGFNKYDKDSTLKTSTMTAHQPSSPQVTDKMPTGSSKARQKKFHRHFTQVDENERVLNYYSCALVGDILLQGHLYVTKNYFAFYSNVFGYVTKLLIPLSSVLTISKERTARIIPNAIAVFTAEEKHVFSSLLSRDSTYKLMAMVLKAANSVEPIESELPVPKDIRPGELEALEFSGDEETSSQSGNESSTQKQSDLLKKEQSSQRNVPPPSSSPTPSTTMPVSENKYHMFLLVSMFLLLLLFISAGVLMYRINRMHSTQLAGPQFVISSPQFTANDVYNEILHWQNQLHSKSAGAVYNFLDSNLNQIAKVRKSLEALSMLLLPNSPSASQAQAPEHRSEMPPEANSAAATTAAAS